MILFNVICSIILWNLLMSIVNKQKTNKLFCGLIGYSGKTPFNKQIVEQLMIWNAFERGEDSAGIYSPKNGLKKAAKHCTKFLLETSIEEDNLLIAHVRAKTVGANTDKNAHPFNEEELVLAHNGTLKNHYGLLRKYDMSFKDYDVDSHIMTAIMAKNKNFKVLSEIDGAAAVLFTNKNNPNILHVFRNKERPLFKGNLNGGMYISSIEDSLKLIGCKNIKEFKENYLYTIKEGLIVGAPLRIASNPYTHNYNSTTTVSPTTSKLLNMILTCDSKNLYYANEKIDLTYGKEYQILDTVPGMNQVIVFDDNLKEITVGRHMFAFTNEWFTENDYVKSRKDLRKKDTEGDAIIKENDYLIVTKDVDDGEVTCLHLKTNEELIIPRYYLKKCSAAEKEEIEGSEEVFDNVLGTEMMFEMMHPNYYNRNSPSCEIDAENDDIDDEEEEDDDTPNDKYYDLMVNEKQLTEDFTKVDHQVTDLVKFMMDFVPDDHLEEFNSKKSEISLHLINCAERYLVTNNS